MNDSPDHLESLIPLAVVVALGCECCARRMTERALEAGTPERVLRRVLKTINHMHELDCLTENVGADVVDRMTKPLQAATAALQTHMKGSQL